MDIDFELQFFDLEDTYNRFEYVRALLQAQQSITGVFFGLECPISRDWLWIWSRPLDLAYKDMAKGLSVAYLSGCSWYFGPDIPFDIVLLVFWVGVFRSFFTLLYYRRMKEVE